MTAPLHVVGCPHCRTLWVSDEYRSQSRLSSQETITCPTCETPHDTTQVRSFGTADEWDHARKLRSRILIHQSDANADTEDISSLATHAHAHAQAQADDQCGRDGQVSPAIATATVDTSPDDDTHSSNQFAQDGDSLATPDTRHREHSRYGPQAERILENGIDGLDNRYSDLVEAKIDADRAGRYSLGDANPSTSGSITYTDTGHIHPDLRIQLDGSPTHAWQQLFDETGNREAFATIMATVARALAEESPEETPWRRRSGTELVDAGVTALDGYIASAFAHAAGGTDDDHDTTTDRIEDFLEVIERLGGTLEADLRTSVDDIITGPIALLALVDVTPTIEIGIDTGDDGFWDSEYSQRQETCKLVTALADVADVRVLTSATQRRKLANRHRQELLGISEATIPHHRDRDRDETMDVQARAEAAADVLDVDSSKVAVLETICSVSAGNLSYHALTAQCDVSPSRRSQILVTDDDSLASLGLVETYHNGTTKRVEATRAGRQCLELIENKIARQRRLQEYFSEGGNPNDNTRVCTTPHEGPHSSAPSGDDEERQFYDVGWLARHHHATVAASGDTGAVCLVDQPIDDVDCAAEPAVSYDADRDELVVSVEAQSITQLAVCLSRALTGQKIRERILTNDRLDAIDVPEIILRNCRGIGGLSSEAADDPAVLRQNLANWCERLCQLSAFTTDDARQEDKQRWKAARTDLLRGAHGLIGTVVHLFDLLGVSLHREIRFPEYASDYQGKSRERSIARFLGIQASVQSRLDHFATYKQLHEHREEKLDGLIRPDVDPTDPYGELIGSIVLVGPGIDAFASPLNHVLNNPKELHEDAPEFAVPIPIRTTDNCNDDRSAFVEAANRVLDTKHLITTPDAVSILQTILQTPYDVTTALASLDSGDTRREIRPDEFRYALAHHDTERLFPDETATVSEVVGTLLTATRPLSYGELVDRAGVARKSISNNRETIGALEALDLLRHTDEGYRIALSFRTQAERRDPVVPEPVGSDDEPVFIVRDVMFDVAVALCDPERFSNADDPLAAYLYGPAPDLWQLRETDPLLAPWIERAATLVGAGQTSVSVSGSDGSGPLATRTVARMGPGPCTDHDQPTIEDVIL